MLRGFLPRTCRLYLVQFGKARLVDVPVGQPFKIIKCKVVRPVRLLDTLAFVVQIERA